ncbi:DUF3108 domain-containing protein [Massilia yuzhufengensis]|uniref:DUF3108 domain-containing protein n=1 Tax=Massilia yuzhufengensis TaxID=1164594 RepID=A0A1I1NY94_9BURK|nr:DUF3108 domain-containing protein [Massilia yuzhufengensis]SFD02376.1 Protein of unknown function [Massilia yuzhufengensis]
MQRFAVLPAGCGLLLALLLGSAAAQDAPAAIKRAVELPPSADLVYELQARQRGFSLKGEAVITWRAGDGKYSVKAESRVPLLGTITEDRSSGAVDAYGLAPLEFVEKRMRKDPTTATFDREARSLRFNEGNKVYPLKGGEQDRVSITWQLASVARAAGDKFKAGSEWPFFVAGRRDAETWVFKVVKREKVRTGLGEVDAVLVSRQPVSDKKDQALDVWLAPQHEWYPVKLRYADGEKEQIEQTLSTVTKR